MSIEEKVANNPNEIKTPTTEKISKVDDDFLEDIDSHIETEEAKASQAKLHRHIMEGDGGVKVGVFSRFKAGFTGLFKGSEAKNDRLNEFKDDKAEQVVEKRLLSLETSGGEIASKKKEILEKTKLKNSEIETAVKDLVEYQKTVEGNIDLFKNDPNFVDSVAELQGKIDEEIASKDETIKELEENKKAYELESAEELETLGNKNGFNDKKEALLEPAERKMESIEKSLEKFTSLYSETREKSSQYAKQSKDYERKLKSLGDGVAQSYMKDKITELKQEIDERLVRFKEAEAKLKERIEVAKLEKAKTQKFMQRINEAGKTPEEVKAMRDKERAKQTSTSSGNIEKTNTKGTEQVVEDLSSEMDLSNLQVEYDNEDGGDDQDASDIDKKAINPDNVVASVDDDASSPDDAVGIVDNKVASPDNIASEPALVSDAELVIAQEADKQKMIEEIMDVFGGKEKYESALSSFPASKKAAWEKYLSLPAAEVIANGLKMVTPKLKGKRAAKADQLKTYIETFTNDIENKVLILHETDWVKVLVGDMDTMTKETLERVHSTLDKCSKNLLTGQHGEDWAINWYKEYKKAEHSVKFDEIQVRNEAKGKINTLKKK